MLEADNMENGFSGADRLEALGQEMVCLVSLGKKESIEKILEEMTKKNVVHYLRDKYRDDWFPSLERYNIDDWEEIFNGYSYLSALSVADVKCELHISNENDGLLLILSLILGEVHGFSDVKQSKARTD